MKVFVTLEREDGDDRKTVDYILSQCVELERNLYEHEIKTQMKITSLPRRGYRFKIFPDIADIEQ